MTPEMTSARLARFWSKVMKTETCWLWTGAKQKGYGAFGVHHRVFRAHRISYELAYGPIGSGLVIDHLCFNRSCVNPAHLRAVTPKQNLEHQRGPAPSNRSSGVRGVSWDKARSKWRVAVSHHNRTVNGGRFDSLASAELAAVALRNRLFTHNTTDRELPRSA